MRPERDADHLPPSSAAVMEEKSYTSMHLWVTPGLWRDHFTFTFYTFFMWVKDMFFSIAPTRISHTYSM